MNRRGLLRVAGAATLGVLIGKPALASVARALPLEELTRRSHHVLLGEPLEAYSQWERIGQRRRIVTYTRVRTDDVLAGADPRDSELLVRTLGGRVGELGELVHGEALLRLGERSVLFVMPSQSALAITAMAQGHYPLFKDARGTERLLRSREARELVNEAGAAVQRLPGLQVSEARSLVRQMVKR